MIDPAVRQACTAKIPNPRENPPHYLTSTSVRSF